MEFVEKSSSTKDSTESDLNVSKEFIEENRISHVIKKCGKKGGPYSKHDKEARRNEVWRLFFDYGYSARKIAELMKVNRNTINSDINYWYSKIVENHNAYDQESEILVILQRLKNQRIRLREEIDKAVSIQQKLAIERFIYDIDSKILNTHQRLGESAKRVWDLSTSILNEHMEKNKQPNRYFTLSDWFSVSKKSSDKISKIISDDRKQKKFL